MDPDHKPESDLSSPQPSRHPQEENEIELPPAPKAQDDNSTVEQVSPSTGRSSSGIFRLLGSAILLGTIAGVGLFLWQRGGSETRHPNWQHVSAATDASASTNQLIHVDGAGTSAVAQSIEVSSVDANQDATRDVRAAFAQNDVDGAMAALQAAQAPPAGANIDVQLTRIEPDSELAAGIEDGTKELYQIELFDSCVEDGDIVEVLVNDVPFATVQIMSRSTVLTIPLSSGQNMVAVRAVRDGGGGVTLAFRTSHGDFFARDMYVGEVYSMGVTVR